MCVVRDLEGFIFKWERVKDNVNEKLLRKLNLNDLNLATVSPAKQNLYINYSLQSNHSTPKYLPQ
jgi:hypothetical protein